MSKDRVEQVLNREITAVYEAEEIDETQETPVLLAREAARGIFEEYEEEPVEVMEAADGFAVTSGSHVIFMGHDGSFDLVDLESTSDDDETDETDDSPADYVLIHSETEEVVRGTASTKMLPKDAAEQNEAFKTQALPFEYVPESKIEGGRIKPAMTLDELQQAVEELLADADPTDEKLMVALRVFDAAKEKGDYPVAVGAAKAVAEVVGKTLAVPKLPVDVGHGPGKSTSGGGAGGKAAVPTTTPPAPGKPKPTGPGAKNEDLDERGNVEQEKLKMFRKQGFKFAVAFKDWMSMPPTGYKTSAEAKEAQKRHSGSRIVDLSKLKESARVKFTFPAARIQEFIEVTQKAGVGDDVSVVRDGDSYSITLDEEKSRAVGTFFKGADVVQESLSV